VPQGFFTNTADYILFVIEAAAVCQATGPLTPPSHAPDDHFILPWRQRTFKVRTDIDYTNTADCICLMIHIMFDDPRLICQINGLHAENAGKGASRDCKRRYEPGILERYVTECVPPTLPKLGQCTFRNK
jgi:hypothetical protein